MQSWNKTVPLLSVSMTSDLTGSDTSSFDGTSDLGSGLGWGFLYAGPPNTGGPIPTRAPPRRAIRAASVARLCLSSSSGSTSSSPPPSVSIWDCASTSSESGSPKALFDSDTGDLAGTDGGDVSLALLEVVSISSSSSSSGGEATGGGGFHLGFSTAGFGATGGEGAPKAPLPCKAAILSFKLPPLPILSFASEADIPPPDFCSRLTEDSSVGAAGESGGVGCFGFHETWPPGFGRGATDGGALDGVDFSKAAIRSRKEPGFGFSCGG